MTGSIPLLDVYKRQVITNPPYGERLEDKKDLPALYRAFGESFKHLDSWSAYMITSYEEAERYFGRDVYKRQRGYTAWDCTSPAFVRHDAAGATLCIPTAFCSYTGEALDQKTPLLRSMQVINEQSLRLLRLFGNTTSKKVVPSVGAEQEYFLVDAEKFMQRKDLIYTGRTLFGAMPPKGQELDDHYFGTIRQRIAGFRCV